MKVWNPLALTIAILLLAACGQDEQLPAGQPEQPAQAGPQVSQPQTSDPATTPPQTTPTQPAAAQPAPVRPAAVAPPVQTDVPYSTTYTGTIQPGMTEADVVAVWGEPVARRQDAGFVYLHFRNGCEVSCGMYDIVILEGDQVIDAVVRFEGHIYAGLSSSPAGQAPVFTPPDSLRGSVDG
jgi:hypothetical protein